MDLKEESRKLYSQISGIIWSKWNSILAIWSKKSRQQFLSSEAKGINGDTGTGWMRKEASVCYTTQLSPSCFLPYSLEYETIEGRTPTILATNSTSEFLDSLLLVMAQGRLERDISQPRCPKPFNLVMINSVMKKGSRLPKSKLLADIASGASGQEVDTKRICFRINFSNTLRRCQLTHLTLKKRHPQTQLHH